MADQLVKEIIEAVPVPMGIADPIYDDDGALADMALSAMNAELTALVGEWPILGLRLSMLAPELISEGWLEHLQTIKVAGASDRRYRRASAQSPNPGDVYQLDAKWFGDVLFLTITSLASAHPSLPDAMRASTAVSTLMSELPISYGVKVGSSWLRFPTKSFLRNISMTLEDFRAIDLLDFVHEADVIRVTSWIGSPIKNRPMPLVFRARHPESFERWLEIWMAQVEPSAVPGGDSEVGDFYIVRDVDPQVRLQKSNQEMLVHIDTQLEVLHSALNASRDGFAIWKAIFGEGNVIASFRLEYINQTGAAATGKMPSELEGRLIEDVVGPEQYEDLFKLFMRAVSEHTTQIEVVQIDSPQGWIGAYENKVVPFAQDQVVASFRDVSEDKREQGRLVWLAEHDHLTGAPNRRQLERNLESAMQSARESDSLAGFVFMDIDGFKKINDDYGHEAGDALLKAFVERLRVTVGDHVFVARIAGDEFAMVTNGIKEEHDLSKIIESVFSSLRNPFNHSLPPISVSISAGGVVSDGRQPLSEVMRLADKAMYRAKHDGRNRFYVVSADIP